MSVAVQTNLGELRVALLVAQAPRACFNFLKLAKTYRYDYSLFHRIEKDFIAQTGDPTGTGRGGDSVYPTRFFADELRDPAQKAHVGMARRGTLAMANSGRDRNASQWFLTLADGLEYLDDRYTVFGLVEEACLPVLARINAVVCDAQGRPMQKVWVEGVRILEDPYPDPAGLCVPAKRPGPSDAWRRFEGLDAAQAVERASQVPLAELEERRRREEARAHALTLEIIGDLPSADVSPPENVLFVCRLNPLTEDADLEMIFARFGPVRSCEVVRDRDTGNSLGYAFVEFERREACEEAYFKMENVLIDDRRVHVDFSQSVGKFHRAWEGRQRAKGRAVQPSAQPVVQPGAQPDAQQGGYALLLDDEPQRARSPLRRERGERSHGQRESHRDTERSHGRERSPVRRERSRGRERSRDRQHMPSGDRQHMPSSDRQRTSSNNRQHLPSSDRQHTSSYNR